MVAMRVYLVIIDESEEALSALRFASRRAAKTEGTVHLLAVVAPQQFNAFAGVQATIEEEARARAEALVTAAAGSLLSESGRMPVISVVQGEVEKVVRDYLHDHPEVSALVLGAAKEGGPGPLVAHFAGAHVAHLPCPVFVIPGSMTPQDIDRVS
jgi:nucleotide-binding universal stress UspA family protein